MVKSGASSGWGILYATLFMALCFCLPAAVHAQATYWSFVHNGPESADDQRYSYHWAVLKAALDATRVHYGAYTLSASNYMNESRQLAIMQAGTGPLNTLVLDSTLELERSLLPVRIPIDKGLLGYRVFLVRSEDQPRFAAVRTLEDLRQFSMGQGSDWSDLGIFKAAGFYTVGGGSYEGLFDMLMNQRFDALGRGVSEVGVELQAHQGRYPKMEIEKTTMVYYPMPVYFWFPKTPQGQQFAKRVEEGMRQIGRDGTLDNLFKTHFGATIESLQLKKRRLFRLTNPYLPPGQPFDNKALWFDPLQ